MSAAPPPAGDTPVVTEPWQARAFAVVVQLCRDGHAEWDDFQRRLIAEIGAADAAGDAATGYYDHWLAACEGLLVERGLAAAAALRSARSPGAARPRSKSSPSQAASQCS